MPTRTSTTTTTAQAAPDASKALRDAAGARLRQMRKGTKSCQECRFPSLWCYEAFEQSSTISHTLNANRPSPQDKVQLSTHATELSFIHHVARQTAQMHRMHCSRPPMPNPRLRCRTCTDCLINHFRAIRLDRTADPDLQAPARNAALF